jgi:hypothetical protein
MTKNVIIAILAFGAALYWIKVDPECIAPNDPDAVVVQYKCSKLIEYQDVPEEVIDDCRNKAEKATNNKKM